MNFIKKRVLSFKYAFNGIFYFIKSQHNAWIHIVAAFFAIVFGFIFNISVTEWCIIIIIISLVLSAEAFNTAIEKIVDLVSPEYNKLAGIIKDVSAGAVLILAIAAALTGIIIFLPKFLIIIT